MSNKKDDKRKGKKGDDEYTDLQEDEETNFSSGEEDDSLLSSDEKNESSLEVNEYGDQNGSSASDGEEEYYTAWCPVCRDKTIFFKIQQRAKCTFCGFERNSRSSDPYTAYEDYKEDDDYDDFEDERGYEEGRLDYLDDAED